MAVGVVPGLVIGLREGLEAALIIGIILAYLTKVDRKDLRRYVYLGVVVAIIGSLITAGLFALLAGEFEGRNEELFEGFAAIVAVVVLTSLILWMMRAAKDIRKHLERKIEVLVGRRQMFGLAFLAFIAVFREGVETVLFSVGLTGATSGADIVTGVMIGLVVSGSLGLGLFRASWKFNLKRFFQVTGAFLIVISAGLFALGVHELQEAYGWGLDGKVYDVSATLPDNLPNDGSVPTAVQVVGSLLRGLVGYNDAPTQLEAIAYFAYWAFTILLYWGIESGRIAIITKPVLRLVDWIKRLFRKSPVQSGQDE